MEDAHNEHLDLDAALDLEDTRALAKESKSSKTKSLASYALLECVKIDHQQSIAMLQSYRKQWLSVMEHHDPRTFESLEEFFRARSLNGGMGFVYPTCHLVKGNLAYLCTAHTGP
jgi:hypothetical protein